jgi:hypothetical protein
MTRDGTIVVRDRFNISAMSNTVIPANALPGVFEDSQTGNRACYTISGMTEKVALLNNGTSIAHHYYRGPCGTTSTGSHGNADGSISATKAVRLNPRPGQAGASYATNQIKTVPGSQAAAQVSAGTFYTPP